MKTISARLITSLLLTLAINLNTNAQTDYYWVGGSGNWSDYENHWATSSGGSEFHTTVPTRTDNVYFDENSFTLDAQFVMVDGWYECRDMDWSDVALEVSMITNDPSATGILTTGSVTFSSTMNNVDFGSLSMAPTASPAVLRSNGIGLNNVEVTLNLGVQSISLEDSLSVKGLFFINIFSDFTSNGHPIHFMEVLDLRSTIRADIDFSNSHIYGKSIHISSDPTLGSLNTEGATISIIYPGGRTEIDKTRVIEPIVSNYEIKADHLIINRNPIFKNLIIQPGVELEIHKNIAGVEFESLIANGTSDDFVVIKSNEDGEQGTLISSSPEVNMTNAILKDINATGGAIYNAYASIDDGNVTNINFLKGDQTISMEVQEKNYHDIGEVYTPAVTTSSGLEVTYESNNDEVVVSNGTDLVIVGVGNALITANQSGNHLYNAAQVTRVMNVTKAPQNIEVTEIEDTWIGDELINVDADVDSSLPLSYQVDGPATINGSVLTLNGTGLVQVTVSQSGDDNHEPAENVTISFDVIKRDQTITFEEVEDVSEDAGFVNLNATVDSGLPISYSVVGPGDVVNGTLEFSGNGMIQVTAMQGGNDLYSAAEDVRRSFEIIASTSEKPLFLTRPEGLGLVYPNPVSDYLYFDPRLKIETVHVSHLSGKVFFDGKLVEDHIDVSSWDPGNYIFQIRTKNGDEITTRIIRN